MDVVVSFVCVLKLMRIIYEHVRTVTKLGISKPTEGRRWGGWGRCGPVAEESFGSGGCFDAPFTPTLCFCSDSKEWNTYCKQCMLTIIKKMRVTQSKISKTNPKTFSNREAHVRYAGPGSAYVQVHVCILESNGNDPQDHKKTIISNCLDLSFKKRTNFLKGHNLSQYTDCMVSQNHDMYMWTYNYMKFWCVWMLSYSSAHIEIKVFFRTGIMRCTGHPDKRHCNSDFNTWIPLPARSRGPEGVLHRRRRIDICFCKWSYIFGHFRDINGKFRTWHYRFQTEHKHVNNIKDCKILTFSRLL